MSDQRWWPTPQEIAGYIRAALAEDDDIHALRMLMDGHQYLPDDRRREQDDGNEEHRSRGEGARQVQMRWPKRSIRPRTTRAGAYSTDRVLLVYDQETRVACQRDGACWLSWSWDHLEVLASMAGLGSGVSG